MTAELTVRTSWALARLGELVNEGRQAGWLAGELLSGVGDSDDVLADTVVDASPMQRLAERLGLSSTELDVLWLLACIEIEPVLAEAARCLVPSGLYELSAQVVDRLSHGFVDLDRLARLGLIETTLDPRTPMYRRPVRASDRVVELARGRLVLDRHLDDVATLALPVTNTEPLAVELERAFETIGAVLIIARGRVGSGRAASLRRGANQRGWSLLSVRTDELATDPDRLVRQLRAIGRECRLHDAVPMFLDLDAAGDRAAALERELFRRWDGPILATSREPCTWTARAPISLEIELPDHNQRADLWQQALPQAAVEVIVAAAARYAICPELISRTATAANAMCSTRAEIQIENIQAALRGQLERQLLGVATRLEVTQTWADLVLPVEQLDVLVELVARVRHRSVVFQDWGFGDKIGRGTGLAALLSGPPGTGKTMVAGLVARELGLDLYQVDLSRIVSKYIGETEKQLAALFDAAEAGHAVLLFDEADSLFGKRTDVRSSNDRYANLEVNYLLQRMESFAGISILTTNHETSIDKAFLRRLAFHIRVPMPEREQRAEMWRAMIPGRARVADDLDVDTLSEQFVMSGGYIRNAVLRAAFLAADEGSPISNGHLLRAARGEYEAMGKVSYRAAG